MPGQPIDSDTMRQLAVVFERRPEVDDFERDLLNDMRERVSRFGSKTHVSEKQAAIIHGVFVKSSRPFGREGP